MNEKFDDTGIKMKWVGGGLGIKIVTENHPEMKEHLESVSKFHLKKDRSSLIAYNQYIALDKYGLKIKFEPNRAIIPTPGLRFRFLEESMLPLKKYSTSKYCPEIIEIGTGASAIIALLAAKHFNCKVHASEVDLEYLEFAQNNILKNNLQDKIQLYNSSGLFLDGVFPDTLKVDLIISNPPYYPELLEKESVWVGDDHELLGEGAMGEKFMINMVKEGLNFLKPNGLITFIIPRKLHGTLIAIEKYLKKGNYIYDIIGLEAGNRIRYVFRIFKSLDLEYDRY